MDIASVQKKHEDKLMKLPNVTGVGIGEKDGEKVINVYVTHKVPLSALKPDEVIPTNLDGYAVDVQELGVVTAQNIDDDV